MQFYQDITLIPDGDVDISFVWRKVFMQIHLAIVDTFEGKEQSDIAVSFPQYGQKGFAFGNYLRVFASSQTQLDKLNLKQWLNRWQDYAHVKSAKETPEHTQFVSFVRKTPKGKARIDRNAESLAKRHAKKTGMPIAQCREIFEKTKPSPGCKLPFLWLDSLTTNKQEGKNKPFPLFIDKIVSDKPYAGKFTTYGLSAKTGDGLAAVPYF